MCWPPNSRRSAPSWRLCPADPDGQLAGGDSLIGGHVPRQAGSGGLCRLAAELRHPLEQILDPFEGYHPFAARFYTEGDQRPRGVLHDAEKKSHSGESSTRPLAAI